MFETDTAGEPDTSTTFVGITGEGGLIDLPGRFEIDEFSGLLSRIIDGVVLDDTITNDGADTDEFVDAGLGYDITLALRNAFVLNPGEATTYTTTTIFGSGEPEDVVSEPTDIDYSITTSTPTLAEGDNGAQAVTFTISRSGATQDASSIDYSIDGSAANGDDYNNIGGASGANGLAGTVSFAAGETDKTITLDVLGDTDFEPNEDINITLNNGTAPNGAATLSTASTTTTIENDDPAPPPGEIIEGTSGIDVLLGTSGDDVITGREGGDILTGNGGNNQFVYESFAAWFKRG